MLSELSLNSLLMLGVGAFGIGFSKSGLSGVSMLHVVLYAFVFGALESTGVLLPLLVVGDLCAILFFGRSADWQHFRKLMPPTLIGVLIGWRFMGWVDAAAFGGIVGGIILLLCTLQATRMIWPGWFEHFPHQTWFAVMLGLLAGYTTMIANAAGPVVALYLLAVNLPKWELIGTSAWLFLVLNVLKLPLSFQLGLITSNTLILDATLAPIVPMGMLTGRWLVNAIPQETFNAVLLVFTAIAALRLLGLF